MTKSLDLLDEEPLELAVALHKLAELRAAEDQDEANVKIWAKFAQAMASLVDDLKALNEPAANAWFHRAGARPGAVRRRSGWSQDRHRVGEYQGVRRKASRPRRQVAAGQR